VFYFLFFYYYSIKMEYVDFKQSKDNIIYQLFHSSDNINKENSTMLFDYYRFLHFFRHNYLHYLVLKSLNLGWSEEIQLKELFSFDMPEEYARKSPDIVHITEDCIFFDRCFNFFRYS